MVEKNTGKVIDIEQAPLEQEVFDNIYAKGKTKNVFQFESPGMRKYLKEMAK